MKFCYSTENGNESQTNQNLELTKVSKRFNIQILIHYKIAIEEK